MPLAWAAARSIVSTPAPAQDHQRQLRGRLDRLGRHLGRADHQDAHVGHGGRQRIGRQVAPHLDLEAQFFQFGNGVGDNLSTIKTFMVESSLLSMTPWDKPAD